MTKPSASPQTEAVLARSIEIGVADGKVSRRVKLLPFGTFAGRDGRGPYVLEDKAHAEQVISATRDFLKSADMLFNYDHQSEFAAVHGVGGKAPASGWINPATLVAEDDGIWGEVDWTPLAESALQAREYRYHSPHFRVDRSTRRVTRLVNAGLTNSPNLDLPALASQESGTTEEGELMKQIALAPLVSALALAATADEAEVLAAIDTLKANASEGEKVLASSRTTLGLAIDADSESVLAGIAQVASARPDPTKWVPKEGFDQLKQRVDKLDDDRVLAMVDDAVAAGKVPPSLKDWAVDLGKKDEAALQSYLGGAPVFEGGKPHGDGKPAPEKGKLTEEEAAVCSMMGIDPQAYLKTRDEGSV